MSTHTWPDHAESQTDVFVLWRCSVCLRPIQFAKPGEGEPTATYQNINPDVDLWLGVCPGIPDEYSGRILSKNDFLARFTSEELGAIATSNDARVKGIYERLNLSSEIQLDHPQWASDLLYCEEVTPVILTDGRAVQILQ